MKTEKNIFVAFFLNLSFSIFELFGGLITNSVAILSDSVHDMGDAIGIGVSYFLEKKSKKKCNNKYTYGYGRYSVLGGAITTTILMVGSVLVVYESIKRIINPVKINYSGMLILAIVGVIVNLLGAFYTREGDSINQKAVNLHMLEDVLGWIIVLIGSIIMHFTDISVIDPLMSMGVAIFILIHAIKNFKEVLDLFLEKTPKKIDIEKLKTDLLNVKEVEDIHHIHVWSIDGNTNYATMHIVTRSADQKKIKDSIRKVLKKNDISHSILETEEEICDDTSCHIEVNHHHHHH